MISNSAVSLPSFLSYLLISCCWAKLEHQFLFPPNDEYDHKILDPNTVYGSPYGGFARATRSRLAKLPLILPARSTNSIDGETTAHYMSVADGSGRRFVCRTYWEDQLEAGSRENSMFDRVVLKQELLNNHDVHHNLQAHHVEYDHSVSTKSETLTKDLEKSKSDQAKTAKYEITSAMEYLKGVCTQLHQGWWSYEWCAKKHVRQFHIELQETGGFIRMESITSLGDFKRRHVELTRETMERRADASTLTSSTLLGDENHKEATGDEEIDRFMHPFLGDETALGYVVDIHEGGDVCTATGLPRTTKVEYRCCSPDHMQKMKPFVIYNGLPIPSDIAAIAHLDEPSTCNYYLLICTPLLCEGLSRLYKNGPDAADPIEQNSDHSFTKRTPPANLRPKKENESIQEIIDRTLEGVCLYNSSPNHWWTYELCHGRHVRQYHEALLIDPITQITSRKLEVEYVLGRHQEDLWESIEPTDEIQYVVNNNTELDVTASGSVPTKASSRGNGAYFFHEYTQGEVCSGNDPDVKDKGGKPRSVTLQYYCGPKFEIPTVDEDSTCHYIMHVTIPDLCEHQLFRKPEEKRQIVKCLLAKD